MKIINSTLYIIAILTMISFWSCNDEVSKHYKPKNIALAKMNEIVVVADDDTWNAVKDSFDYYFGSAYPLMPSPEPKFDIRRFSPKLLEGEPLRKELRTYVIIADLNDQDSPTTKMVRNDIGEKRYLKAKSSKQFNVIVGKDKWAKNQILIYLFGFGKDNLYRAIRENYPAIAQRIREHDKDQLDASIYVLKGENKSISRAIKEKMGIDIKVPGDFVWLKKDEDNFVWLKKDTPKAALNIIIRQYPYTSQSQFSKDHLIKLRDEYGKKYISSHEEGSYMTSNVKDLPVMEYDTKIDNRYTKEIRGIWELVNDYMGGPYATYMIHDKDHNRVIFIDAWVFAPGTSKRNYMMQLDHIIKSIKIEKTPDNNQNAGE